MTPIIACSPASGSDEWSWDLEFRDRSCNIFIFVEEDARGRGHSLGPSLDVGGAMRFWPQDCWGLLSASLQGDGFRSTDLSWGSASSCCVASAGLLGLQVPAPARGGEDSVSCQELHCDGHHRVGVLQHWGLQTEPWGLGHLAPALCDGDLRTPEKLSKYFEPCLAGERAEAQPEVSGSGGDWWLGGPWASGKGSAPGGTLQGPRWSSLLWPDPPSCPPSRGVLWGELTYLPLFRDQNK